MRKLWSYFKIEWLGYLEYRGDLIVYTLTAATFPLLSLFMWLAIPSNSISGFTSSDFIVYFLLVLLVNVITSAWSAPFIAQHINNGEMTPYLIKPMSFFKHYLVMNLVEKIYKIFITVFVIIILAFFMKDLINLKIDFNLLSLLLFFFSLLLATMISFILDLIVGLSAFWFQDIDFFRNTLNAASQFLSGRIIPFPLLPLAFLNIVTLLPFRYTLGFPIEIILGKVTGQNLILGFIIQIIWLLIFVLLYKWVMQNGIKRYQGYGA